MSRYLPLFLLVGVTATLVMASFLLLRGLLERRRRLLERRLKGDGSDEPVSLVLEGAFQPPPETWSDRLDQAFQRLIKHTGLGWTTEQALSLMVLLSVALAGVFLVWTDALWLVGVGLMLGLSLPLTLFLYLQARRRQQIQEQLPDVFFLLARSLRAGQNLELSMTTVAQHGSKPLADEFRRAVEQIGLGLTVPAALQGMARRVNLIDFDVFVTAVTLHRTLGGSLTLLLERVANSTRDRNLFRGYFRTATALSRITAFCIAAAVPVLLVLYSLWQPEFIARFGASAAGIQALGLALVLEVVGVVWLWMLLRVEY